MRISRSLVREIRINLPLPLPPPLPSSLTPVALTPRPIRVVFQTLLRQDDTNGGVAEAVAAEMRDMPSEDPTAEADSHPARRK